MNTGIPVLMITYNRLEYTRKALQALLNSDCGDVVVIDNGSTDGTVSYLRNLDGIGATGGKALEIILIKENKGIANAMNKFLIMTKEDGIVGKVDNDTIVPKDWCSRMQPYIKEGIVDILQAKHHIIPATHPEGWKGFTKGMIRSGSLLFNHFVGGSGILFRRDKVTEPIPDTTWKLGGWRAFQSRHPELVKAFCEDVEIKLLDEHGYNDYPDYYKETKRL